MRLGVDDDAGPAHLGKLCKMRNKILLVAEQDDAGRVVAVWKRAKAERIARPMVRNDLDRTMLSEAVYHGASPQEITRFIDALPRA